MVTNHTLTNMTLYKISLTISGDNFKSSLVSCPTDKMIIDDAWETNVPHAWFRGGTYLPCDGGILLMHNRCWATTEEHKEQYEADFVDFLLENEEAFTKLGAEEILCYYEVLHDENCECDVSLFSPTQLKRLAKLSLPLSLPVSVYPLETPHFQEYLEGVNNAWK